MNPELQTKLVGYLDKLEKGAEKVGEFAEREIPETIREWLMWLAIERFSYAAIFLIASIASFFLVRWLARLSYRAWEEFKSTPAYAKTYDRDIHWNLWVGMTVLQWVTVVSLSVGVFYWGLQGTKVLVSPRVVIVEEVSHLVHKQTK